MRRLLFSMLFLPLVLTACKQEDDDDDTVPAATTAELQVQGLQTVEVEKGGYEYAGVSVSSTNNVQSTVTLSVTGLPAGLTANFDFSGGGNRTPFSAAMIISASQTVASGAVNATLVATPASGTAKSFPFTINVLPGCAEGLAGSYNGVQTCSFGGGGATAYTSTVTMDAAVTNRILISNFGNRGATVFANINCNSGGGGGSTGSISIPQQSPSGSNFVVEGYGSLLSGGTLDIDYTTTPLGSSNSTSCGTTLTR